MLTSFVFWKFWVFLRVIYDKIKKKILLHLQSICMCNTSTYIIYITGSTSSSTCYCTIQVLIYYWDTTHHFDVCMTHTYLGVLNSVKFYRIITKRKHLLSFTLNTHPFKYSFENEKKIEDTYMYIHKNGENDKPDKIT